MTNAPRPLQVVVISQQVSLLHDVSWILDAVGYKVETSNDLGPDALWTSFPVSSFVNLALAVGYYWKGGWRKAHMRVEDSPDEAECTEEALATREPGGALNPAG